MRQTGCKNFKKLHNNKDYDELKEYDHFPKQVFVFVHLNYSFLN